MFDANNLLSSQRTLAHDIELSSLLNTNHHVPKISFSQIICTSDLPGQDLNLWCMIVSGLFAEHHVPQISFSQIV